MKYRKWIVFGIVGMGLVLICIFFLSLAVVIYLIQGNQIEFPLFGKSDDSIRGIEGSVPLLLSSDTFPTKEIEYPVDWPSDLIFPQEFIVVETNSGTLSEDVSLGWVTKLRFQGDISQAEDLLTSHFERNNWQILEQNDLNIGSKIILIAHPEASSTGIVLLESDATDNAQSLIVVTVNKK